MGKIRRPKSRKPKSRRSKARRTNARRTKSSGKRRTFRKNCMKKCRRTCKQRGGGAKEERRLADIAALSQELNNMSDQAAIIDKLVEYTPDVAARAIEMQKTNNTKNLDWDFITAESKRIRMQKADAARDMSMRPPPRKPPHNTTDK